MNKAELLALAKRLGEMQQETGSVACLGCGYEHDCHKMGCVVIKLAKEAVQELANDKKSIAEKKSQKVAKLRICLEIQGMAVDGNGNNHTGGLQVTLCDVPVEEYQRVYERMINEFGISTFLKIAGLDKVHTVDECRIIPSEEYDAKYTEVYSCAVRRKDHGSKAVDN